MPTPKSPEEILAEYRKPLYLITKEGRFSLEEDEKWLRSSMAGLLLYMAERMGELSVEPIPELEGADAIDCQVRDDIIDDCRAILTDEAKKITNNE